MKTPAYLAAALVTLLAVSACDGPSARNSVPNPSPTATIGSRAARRNSGTVDNPRIGATLTVRQCEWYPLYVDFCADRSPMTFDVQDTAPTCRRRWSRLASTMARSDAAWRIRYARARADGRKRRRFVHRFDYFVVR